ncbi:MAG: polyphosphate polymerase domain-containing protein [Actinobacteria bacterium]|nr:polyphosphate polymerase domain-containing protein [Actinomycetota bacterium]
MSEPPANLAWDPATHEDRRVAVRPQAGLERRLVASPLRFRRIELKYVIPERLVEQFTDRISPFTEFDPFLKATGRSSYPVTSLYFDSFDLQCLFEKEAGLLARRKVRLRTYDGDFSTEGTAFLEIKRRHDFLVSKDRLPLSIGDEEEGSSPRGTLRHLLRRVKEVGQHVIDEAKTLDAWYNLRSTAMVAYDRIAFVSKEDPELRLTIDRDLKGVWRPPALRGPMPYRRCGIHPVIPRLVAYGTHRAPGPDPLEATAYSIVEFKFASGIPGWLHNIVIDMQLMRSAYSKYAFAVRNLRPNLYESMED